MHTWQLQEAKAKLSEVVKLCQEEGPQILSVRGEEKVVMLSKGDYDALVTPPPTLLEFLLNSPLKGLDLEFPRDKSLPRDIEL